MHSWITLVVNPQRACEGYCSRSVCQSVRPSVRPSVCLFGDISLLEPSIAPQTILRIQRSIKVGKYVGIFLKLLCSRVMA